MECLHGIPASATTTKNGLFWYCGNKPSCQFFCPHKDRDIFASAVASFKASGCLQPICHAHQKLAKMRVVKDNTKGNGGRPFFVCSDRNNPCSFWQWGDVVESPKPICHHGLTSRVRKVKKDGPNKDRLFYCCPNDKENSCGFFEWKPQEYSPVVEDAGCLFTHPLQYQYQDKDMSEAITNPDPDYNEAYGEYEFNQTANAMAQDMERLEKFEGRSFNEIVRNRVIASTGKLYNEVDWSSPDIIRELTEKGVGRVVNF